MGAACCDSSQAIPDLRMAPKGGINRNNQTQGTLGGLGGGMPMDGEDDAILSDEG